MISELREWFLISNVQAFSRVVRHGESSQDDVAYYTLFGGGTFRSFLDHPRQKITKGGYTSTAAGAYQALASTWDDYCKAAGGKQEFTPENQDMFFVWCVKRRKALDDVIAGRFDQALSKCSWEWASLPPSRYNQPVRPAEEYRRVYLKYGGTLAENQTDVPQIAEKPVAPIVIPILTSLLSKLPELASMFGSGSESSNRNIAAGKVIADELVKATQAVNLQDAAERIQSDPEALSAARTALANVMPSITEAGGGGIDGARKAVIDQSGIPLHRQPTFIIAMYLLVLISFVTVAVMLKVPWIAEVTAETRAGVIMFLMGSGLGGVIGFYYGTTATQGGKRVGDK